ncbi:hypothetical protein DICPUDRAFT_83593 [Dictyostelium purpureum]|uniref:Peroxinectin n=1 Tax=Dictyostelium purpureum TaxID=5786 RepID=F1A000_DICPU|nr:uncharacterized protein DICPUDRAFT_83593 [Dictyostelium purpureum]EGC30492.1 hypothetical protein DICPUDRAFT_83593 [Dictyostelium purpureum]|eukprot:XP_003292994.1 hypothetical protein DICPUDRAFT_83593 [Dictyostelium purpureum]
MKLYYLLICIIAIFITITNSLEFRTYSGENNNIRNPNQGASNKPFTRISKPKKFNVKDSPAITTTIPRVVSNVVFDQTQRITSKEHLTDMFNAWGRFFSRNIASAKPNEQNKWPIIVPKCDPYYDPKCTGSKTMDYYRSEYTQIPCTEEGTVMEEDGKCYDQINGVSSYLDGKSIYGNNEDICQSLRTHQGGEMKMNQTPELGDLPPKNVPGVPVDNEGNLFPTEQLYSVGERRANENPGLLAIHTLFLREHNRIARRFAKTYSDWDDETIFQRSRSCIIEQIQKITYEEYLPLLLGYFANYTGYNPNINSQVSNEFFSTAFKFVHSEMASSVEYYDEDGSRLQPLPLKFSFFNPHALNQGIEPLIRGLILNEEENVDTSVVSDLRNNLFGKPGQGGSDLVSIDLQMTHDHGIPLYNSLRMQLGLRVATNWSHITSDEPTQNRLKQAYKTVDDVDALTGGLAEDHMQGSCVGQLFYSIIYEQFYRTRAGDRFWYETPSIKILNRECGTTSFSNIIKRNTLNIGDIPLNVFKK